MRTTGRVRLTAAFVAGIFSLLVAVPHAQAANWRVWDRGAKAAKQTGAKSLSPSPAKSSVGKEASKPSWRQRNAGKIAIAVGSAVTIAISAASILSIGPGATERDVIAGWAMGPLLGGIFGVAGAAGIAELLRPGALHEPI